MYRILISNHSAIAATGLNVSYSYHVSNPDDKLVTIIVTHPQPQFEVETLRRNNCTEAEICEFDSTDFYYDMDKFCFEDALEDAYARVRHAVINGWIDLSDLDCE